MSRTLARPRAGVAKFPSDGEEIFVTTINLLRRNELLVESSSAHKIKCRDLRPGSQSFFHKYTQAVCFVFAEWAASGKTGGFIE